MMDFNKPVEKNVPHFAIEFFLRSHWIANRKILLIGLSDKGNYVDHKWLVFRIGLLGFLVSLPGKILDVAQNWFGVQVVMLLGKPVLTNILFIYQSFFLSLLTIQSPSHLLI
jgi:hypothetical protein